METVIEGVQPSDRRLAITYMTRIVAPHVLAPDQTQQLTPWIQSIDQANGHHPDDDAIIRLRKARAFPMPEPAKRIATELMQQRLVNNDPYDSNATLYTMEGEQVVPDFKKIREVGLSYVYSYLKGFMFPQTDVLDKIMRKDGGRNLSPRMDMLLFDMIHVAEEGDLHKFGLRIIEGFNVELLRLTRTPMHGSTSFYDNQFYLDQYNDLIANGKNGDARVFGREYQRLPADQKQFEPKEGEMSRQQTRQAAFRMAHTFFATNGDEANRLALAPFNYAISTGNHIHNFFTPEQDALLGDIVGLLRQGDSEGFIQHWRALQESTFKPTAFSGALPGILIHYNMLVNREADPDQMERIRTKYINEQARLNKASGESKERSPRSRKVALAFVAALTRAIATIL